MSFSFATSIHISWHFSAEIVFIRIRGPQSDSLPATNVPVPEAGQQTIRRTWRPLPQPRSSQVIVSISANLATVTYLQRCSLNPCDCIARWVVVVSLVYQLRAHSAAVCQLKQKPCPLADGRRPRPDHTRGGRRVASRVDRRSPFASNANSHVDPNQLSRKWQNWTSDIGDYITG